MYFHLKKTLSRGKGMIFAIPQTNHYQKISNLKINPSPNITILDEWGNEVIILNDVKNFSLKFAYQGKTFNFEKNKLQSFFLKDYQKLDKKILSFYSKPNRFFHSESKKIYLLAKKIVGEEKNLFKITEKLYQFVLDYLIYDNPIDGLYSDFDALEKKRVDCGGFSSLYLSLLNSLKIPARLVIGFIVISKSLPLPLNFNNLLMHAWVEILLPDNSFFPADPSIDWKRSHQTSHRQGGFGFIPNDRLVISYGACLRYKIEDKDYQFDIIQKPLPL